MIEQRRSSSLDQRSDAWRLVARQVVHDDDVSRAHLRDENLLDVYLEGVAIDRTVEHERDDQAGEPQPGDEGGRLPVTVRHARPQALAPERPSVAPGHVGRGPGLVDEDEAGRIKVELLVEPQGLSAEVVAPTHRVGLGYERSRPRPVREPRA